MENSTEKMSSPITAIERSPRASNQEARSADQPLQQSVTKQMIFFSLYISLIGWVFNFDLGYGGTVLPMEPYRRSFGQCGLRTNPATGVTAEVCQQTALQQALVSLTLIFIALGGAISGVVGNYFGRRGTIQVGALLAAVGAAGMLGTAGNFTAYLVCKCIGGVGLGHLIATAGTYGAECIVAQSRGVLLSLYSIGLGLGNVVAAAVCWGSSSYSSNLAWQIPIICQIPLSAILFLGSDLFPEAPRWLLTKGRHDAAKSSFAWYYAKPADHVNVLLQVEDVLHHIELEKLNGSTTKWTDIYRGTNFRRTVISGLIMVGLAITGSKFVIPYGALFLEQAGTRNPFLNNFIIGCCILGGTVGGPWVIEQRGRRFSMLCGYTTMTACMLIIGIVGSALGQTSDTARVVLLVFLFLWAFLFGLFIGASVWVSAPEQHSLQMRTYGQASTTLVYQIFGFGSSFYGSYMLNPQYGNMGLNIAYFHAGVTFVMTVLVFLLVPETARLTLEQIDEHFLSGRAAWRTSIDRNKRIARAEAVDHEGEHGYVGQKL